MDFNKRKESKKNKGVIKMKKKKDLGYYVTVALLFIGSLIMILPLYWMVISSFKGQAELLQMPPTMFPKEWVMTNFQRVLDSIPFIRYYANSLGVTIISTVIAVFSSCIIGFVFAKYKFKGRDIIFLTMLAFVMIPYDTLMIPLYKIMANLKLTNSYFVLTVPYFVNIFGIFLMRQFFIDYPNDYLEAAEVDGCGHFKRFFMIVLPMAKPMASALFIYIFMAVYNSFLWPLISVHSNQLFTLPVGIAALYSSRGTQTDLIMAASTMMVIPLMIVFAAVQKNFIEGLTIGGIKG